MDVREGFVIDLPRSISFAATLMFSIMDTETHFLEAGYAVPLYLPGTFWTSESI